METYITNKGYYKHIVREPAYPARVSDSLPKKPPKKEGEFCDLIILKYMSLWQGVNVKNIIKERKWFHVSDYIKGCKRIERVYRGRSG